MAMNNSPFCVRFCFPFGRLLVTRTKVPVSANCTTAGELVSNGFLSVERYRAMTWLCRERQLDTQEFPQILIADKNKRRDFKGLR
jgi:hypothetical protein